MDYFSKIAVLFCTLTTVLLFQNTALGQTNISCNVSGNSSGQPGCNARHTGGAPITHIRHSWYVSSNHAAVFPAHTGTRETTVLRCICRTASMVTLHVDYDTLLLGDNAFVQVFCPATSGAHVYQV